MTATPNFADDDSNIMPFVGKPQPKIVLVSPDVARRWLQANTVNRKVRDGSVNMYARDMIEGRWTISESAICFSPDNKLLNGQHRLRAVIKANASIPMLVMFGVHESAMGNMDSGAKRSISDDLGFRGEAQTPLLAATVKLAMLYTDGRIYRDNKMQRSSPAAVRAFLDENPDLRDAVSVSHRFRTTGLLPTVQAVGYWLTAQLDSDDAMEFLRQLNTRTNLPAGSPVLALDSRLRQVRYNRTHLTHRDALGLFIKSWNHWRAGRSVKTVALTTHSQANPIPEPR